MRYKKILLVDDDADDAEIFSMALHTIDEKLVCVIENNALQALKNLKAAKKLPDIIFLDFNMPYLDGHEFLKLLRDVEGLKKIPVVLYSGHTDEAMKELTKNFKKLDYLTKPNSYREIIKALKKIIE
ncbi:MAG: response regulator [Flavobacterium sp.]